MQKNPTLEIDNLNQYKAVKSDGKLHRARIERDVCCCLLKHSFCTSKLFQIERYTHTLSQPNSIHSSESASFVTRGAALRASLT